MAQASGAVSAVHTPMAQEGAATVPSPTAGGTAMRQRMPATAALVDELRAALGREAVDTLLRDTARGGRRFYAAELVDGQLREWGRAPSGRVAAVSDGQVVLVRASGRRVVGGAA